MNVRLLGAGTEIKGRKPIKDSFPEVSFVNLPQAAKERLWTRGELAKVFGRARSMIVEDIQALEACKSEKGTSNYLELKPNKPLTFAQAFYVYLMRMWFKDQREVNQHKKPLRKTFVETVLNHYETNDEGVLYQSKLHEFVTHVEKALSHHGHPISAMSHFERMLDKYLAHNQGDGNFIDDSNTPFIYVLRVDAFTYKIGRAKHLESKIAKIKSGEMIGFAFNEDAKVIQKRIGKMYAREKIAYTTYKLSVEKLKSLLALIKESHDENAFEEWKSENMEVE